ncbi:hypothetical protein EV699_102137 [Plasticicumulans lactativorans]|uniref:Uncharacterized protein n=1 Tax=Plasticicumulans lactativorans TaxID=1133106 RepID=A0A4R2L7G4_9GAMM|nr:hypothetical protein [Plasticicumulans lactativorans]TCO83439.1 hypothetical protein EV699_102137 [Plasticicumulans lactativorans]
MHGWLEESMMKDWAEAQRRLWETLVGTATAGPGKEAAAAWREMYRQNLSVWERSVRETLERQSAWVEDWVERVKGQPGGPEAAGEIGRQIEEGLRQWMETQNRLWAEMFTALRAGQTEGGEAPVPAASAAAVEIPVQAAAEPAAPAAAPEPAATAAAAEPAAAEPAAGEAGAEAPAAAAKPAPRPRRRTPKPAE